VYALADAIGPRYRTLVLLATFASLRWADLAALRPGDIDLKACTVRVTRPRSDLGPRVCSMFLSTLGFLPLLARGWHGPGLALLACLHRVGGRSAPALLA
jgi:hypothetical protein